MDAPGDGLLTENWTTNVPAIYWQSELNPCPQQCTITSGSPERVIEWCSVPQLSFWANLLLIFILLLHMKCLFVQKYSIVTQMWTPLWWEHSSKTVSKTLSTTQWAEFLNAVYFRRGLTCTFGLTNDLIDGGQPRAEPHLRKAKPNHVFQPVFSQ